ncbi:uncharacterized protein LOC106171383 [Lingula anatina]|uniref:Uncharacterized protein LOC106171383 n=1 Tax=Lingula anatina TaxID=7574 RepID=A0A1S3JAD1_LINAN|nr:uncharacterized protein LOC106171383 [Lingula anatina]|eukprot:XP_013407156.1 uncharacterized protein LOC106171383 [Lingula anatina]
METKAKFYAGAVPLILAIAWGFWGTNVGEYFPDLSASFGGENKDTNSNLKGHMEKFGEQVDELTEIPTLDHFPEPEVFYRDYMRKSVPLVVKGALKHWPAVEKWKNEDYLRERFGHRTFLSMWRNITDAYHPAHMMMSMADFLDNYREHKIYMDSTVCEEMAEDLTFPGYIACDEYLKILKQVAIFFNSGWSSTDIHLDVTETIFAQVTGGRQWILTTPSDGKYLYSDEFEHHDGMSPVNQEAVDLQKYPDVSKIAIYKAILEPGDIIYVPEGWWHQVRTHGGPPNIAIAIFIDFLLCMFNTPPSNDSVYIDNCIKLREEKPEEIKCNIRIDDMPIREVFSKYKYLKPEAMDIEQESRTDRDEEIILKSGYSMPVLGLGVGGMTPDEAERGIRHALKIGNRLFDTDPEDESETTLGSILSENEYCKREDVFVIVKVHPKNLGKEATRMSIERSMKRLKTDYIDLVLIKAPSCDTKGFECDADENRGTWQESWKVMEEMNKTGSIRSIGVSNFKISQLKELMAEATVPVSVLQARFDLIKRNTKLRKFCDANGIRFMAHSLLGFGWVKDGSTTNNPILNSDMVMLAARKYRTSPASILIRYALDRDITVVPRSSNPLHISLNKHSTSLDIQDSPDIMEDLENFPHVQ